MESISSRIPHQDKPIGLYTIAVVCYSVLVGMHIKLEDERLEKRWLILVRSQMLVASMAAVTVWQLLADDSPPATELKNVLSGHQMKRRQPFTAPALLAGLWSLPAMLDTLEHHALQALHTLIAQVRLPVPLMKTD